MDHVIGTAALVIVLVVFTFVVLPMILTDTPVASPSAKSVTIAKSGGTGAAMDSVTLSTTLSSIDSSSFSSSCGHDSGSSSHC